MRLLIEFSTASAEVTIAIAGRVRTATASVVAFQPLVLAGRGYEILKPVASGKCHGHVHKTKASGRESRPHRQNADAKFAVALERFESLPFRFYKRKST